MNERILPSKVVGAVLNITDQCNFRCSHCYEGQPGSYDMPFHDVNYVLQAIDNPCLRTFLVFGGEARLHRRFPEIMQMIRQQFKRGRDVTVALFTNGFGMIDKVSTSKVITGLYRLGVDHLDISLDMPHRLYSQAARTNVDYKLLEILCRGLSGRSGQSQDQGTRELREEMGIPKEMAVKEAGTGTYIMPIGKARNLSWPERLRLNAVDPKREDEIIRMVKGRLDTEYEYWDQTPIYPRCYCDPSELYQRFKDSGGERGYEWRVDIKKDLSINVCRWGILPPIGNLKEMTLDQAYTLMVKSQLYQGLAEQGPHGLTRLLTNLSEEQIYDRFLERAPCGLCEDLTRQYPNEVREMLGVNRVPTGQKTFL